VGSDVQWLHPRGDAMCAADWNDPQGQSLAVLYHARSDGLAKLLLLFNASGQRVDFAVPQSPTGRWRLVADTADPGAEGVLSDLQVARPYRSVAMYERAH
jgi:glycogen operon protein